MEMASSKFFEIEPHRRFDGPPVSVQRPKEIASFSYDETHTYFADDRSLRYYYPSRMNISLSEGFETFRRHDDSQDEHLDSLLRALARYENEHGIREDANIVTWRGMVTKIMASPYDNSRQALSFFAWVMLHRANYGSFEMNATRFQGTIFIEENHDFKIKVRDSQGNRATLPGQPSQDLMSFWGYKFETLSTISKPWSSVPRNIIEDRENQTVDNNAQYCSIVRTAIGETSLILGGEVDAVWDQKPYDLQDPINWVELKTSALIENDRDMLKYERKLMKYWIQSFLLGVPRIIVGMRDRQGVLRNLDELETQKIPMTVKRNGRGLWSGSVCINFTAAFFTWLLQAISGDGVWRIRRQDRSSIIEVFRVSSEGCGQILQPDFFNWRNMKPA